MSPQYYYTEECADCGCNLRIEVDADGLALAPGAHECGCGLGYYVDAYGWIDHWIDLGMTKEEK